MPITDELGRRVASRLGLDYVPHFRADGITFKSWPTWLAKRQPFLTEAEYLYDRAEAEQLYDRARFAELSEAIAASQLAAEQSGYPHRMGELVDLLHWGQSEVVTLNYDTIVETSLDRSPRGAGDEVVRPSDAVTGFPNCRTPTQLEQLVGLRPVGFLLASATPPSGGSSTGLLRWSPTTSAPARLPSAADMR